LNHNFKNFTHYYFQGKADICESQSVDKEFERMRNEHLRKQQQMEMKRNEEELYEMKQKR